MKNPPVPANLAAPVRAAKNMRHGGHMELWALQISWGHTWWETWYISFASERSSAAVQDSCLPTTFFGPKLRLAMFIFMHQVSGRPHLDRQSRLMTPGDGRETVFDVSEPF